MAFGRILSIFFCVFFLIFATSLAFSNDINISDCAVLTADYLGQEVYLGADITGFGAACFSLSVADDDNYFHLDC